MTRSAGLAGVLVAALGAAIGCSSEPTPSPTPFNPLAGAGMATGGSFAGAGVPGAAGVPGVATAGAGGAPTAGSPGLGAGAGGAAAAAGTGGSAATAGAGGTSAGTGGDTAGTGGTGAQAGSTAPTLPECESDAPAEFEPNPTPGGGAGSFTDSPHFRIYGASGSAADGAIGALEAAYACFVETLCWRSSGLSIHDDTDSGPWEKMNIYSVGSLGGAGGQMFSDAGEGMSFLRVVSSYLADPKVIVHEYGHSLTYYEKGWIDQTRTGAWWETVANFVADTYMTSPLCADARDRFSQPEGQTIIDLNKVLGSSFQVIVDGSSGSGNYYQAWPFLTYLTNNPDGFAGLGVTALRDMFRQHAGNNETPLHVLERVASPTSVQQIVGRYWARMAYLDIGHEQAQEAFMSRRGSINFANLDAAGSGMYRVKAARQPRYFGSNIVPLTGTGNVSVAVTSSGAFTATLAVRASSGAVRYVDLPDGSGSATVASDEEASLVVVNTPDALVLYDPFQLSGAVSAGLDYQVQLTGATPAD